MESENIYSAKTVAEATEIAAAELGVPAEQLEVEVLEEEKGGFFGLFKSAKIRVTVKGMEAVSEKESTPVAEEKAEEPAEEPLQEKKPAKEIKDADPAATAADFLEKVLTEMNLSAEITAEFSEEEETIYIDMQGSDMGVLIGKRGQTLDSLQYLTSLVVNRACGHYLKIKLDTENYRERRKETLENLAANIAAKVKRTHRSVSLEPMNPYERRIIHAALHQDKYVETHSEGEEPYRKVVVTPKKGVYASERRYGNDRYGSGRYGSGGRYNSNYGKKNFKNRKYSDGNSEDYSQDYMKDYAAYKESKAAEKAAAEEAAKSE